MDSNRHAYFSKNVSIFFFRLQKKKQKRREMGTGKKEKNRVAASRTVNGQGKPSALQQAGVKKSKGENFYRDAKSVAKRNQLNSGRAVRDKNGKILQAAAYQSRLPSGTVGRVAPNRKWFGKHIFFFFFLLRFSSHAALRCRQHPYH